MIELLTTSLVYQGLLDEGRADDFFSGLEEESYENSTRMALGGMMIKAHGGESVPPMRGSFLGLLA